MSAPGPPPPPPPPRADPAALADGLRAAGLVPTPQRRAVWSALRARTDHPTADGLYLALGGARTGPSRTTVYRVLEALVRGGLARTVGHTGTAVRYDPRTHAHDHLLCELCGAVSDLEPGPLDADAGGREGNAGAPRPAGRAQLAERARRAAEGFEVREVSLLVRGRCAACR